MKNLIDFMCKHCTKEEFIDMVLDNDICPGRLSLIPEPKDCFKRTSCEQCWEYALKNKAFLEDDIKLEVKDGKVKIVTND